MTADARGLDVAIIGAGHNGLVCACYLAQAGLRVGVFERRDVVGGAAVTEEFHPGFRNSAASYTVSLLNPKVIRDLRLAERGLRIVERPFSNFLPTADGGYLRMGGGPRGLAARDREVLRARRRAAARTTTTGSSAWPTCCAACCWRRRPTRAAASRTSSRAWKTAGACRGCAPQARADVLDLFTMAAGDWLERWFESDPIKACFGFDSVVGNFASPWSPGTAYVLLHHVFGEVNGKKGTWGHAVGGMGAITQALAEEAQARGATIRTGVAVERILEAGGRAAGLALSDGTEVAARCVVANANPRPRREARRRRPVAGGVRQLPVRERHLPHERGAVRSCPTSPACPGRRPRRTIPRESSLRPRSPTWTGRTPRRARRGGRASPSWRCSSRARWTTRSRRAARTSRASSASTSAMRCRRAVAGRTSARRPPMP